MSVAALPTPTYETGFRRVIIVVTVVMCSLLELIDTSIVNVAIPQLMGNLGATLSEVSWVIASYAIANVIVVPMTGWFSNQFGRRNYFAASVALFTVASFLCGNSHTIWELIFFRFVQGIGGGALIATSQAILTETFPPEQRGFASALFGMGVILGPTLGPTLGGLIIDSYDWPWIFYVNLPLGIIATFLTLTFLVDKIPRRPIPFWNVDWLGVALLVVGVGSMQMVLEQGESEDWFDSRFIIAFTAIAIIGTIGFIWRELTAKNPIVNLRVLRNRNLAFGTILSFVLGFGLFSSVFVIPVFVQRILGFTATQTGMMFIPGALTSGLMMPIIGGLLQKGVPQKFLIMIGFTISAGFTFWIANLVSPVMGESDFFYPLLLRGMGMGFLFVPITTLALTGLEGIEIAQGSGITSMVRQLGGSFGVAIMSNYIGRMSFQHRNDLASYITQYDTATQERMAALTQAFVAKGATLYQAQQQVYATLDLMLQKQTMILTYIDVFEILSLFFICCLPIALFIKRTKTKGKVNLEDAMH